MADGDASWSNTDTFALMAATVLMVVAVVPQVLSPIWSLPDSAKQLASGALLATYGTANLLLLRRAIRRKRLRDWIPGVASLTATLLLVLILSPGLISTDTP